MSTLLEEALAQLNLQPGETYRTAINGHAIEVRMLNGVPPEEAEEEPSQFADMVMLNLWLDVPPSSAAGTVKAQWGPLPPIDPPIIPPYDEEYE